MEDHAARPCEKPEFKACEFRDAKVYDQYTAAAVPPEAGKHNAEVEFLTKPVNP